jgi:hypothetical protein
LIRSGKRSPRRSSSGSRHSATDDHGPVDRSSSLPLAIWLSAAPGEDLTRKPRSLSTVIAAPSFVVGVLLIYLLGAVARSHRGVDTDHQDLGEPPPRSAARCTIALLRRRRSRAFSKPT